MNLPPEYLPRIRTLVAALRSGEYFQCFGVYCKYVTHYPEGKTYCHYCAEGVMRDLYGKMGRPVKEAMTYFFGPGGINIFHPTVDYPVSLVYLNDTRRFSFSEIADIIEKTYLTV
jgi:hypothetical protein